MVSLGTLAVTLAAALAIGECATKLAKLTSSKKDDAYVAKYVSVVNAVSSLIGRIIPTFSDLKK